MISSRQFDCSICDREYEMFTIFWHRPKYLASRFLTHMMHHERRFQVTLCYRTSWRPIQPVDVQRITREPLEDAFSSSNPASPSLSHIGLFGQQHGDVTSIAVSSFFRNYVQGEERTLLENISREAGGTDVSIEEGLNVSLPGTVAGSF